MKLTLISPKRPPSLYDQLRPRANVLPNHPLSLPLLASITPGFEIDLIDENVEPIDVEKPTDLVGISLHSTSVALRGYQIADEFKKNGIPVIIGGAHATVLPDEAIVHADSVVIGEAEPIWKNLLDDFKKGELKQFYKENRLADLNQPLIPGNNLLKRSLYGAGSLMFSRGCPHNCIFCLASKISGSKCRYRRLEDISKELESSPFNNFYIFDDDIMLKPEYIKEVLADGAQRASVIARETIREVKQNMGLI